jgi:ATP-dependent Clp protease ATP-binding subunit ClpX
LKFDSASWKRWAEEARRVAPVVEVYTRLFEMEGVKLTFEPSALKKVIEMAQKRKTGARALRSICEEALTDMLFDLPSQKDVGEVVITAAAVERREPPKQHPLKKRKSA